MIVIGLRGDFTDEEALAILQKVRDVEQARPEMNVACALVADTSMGRAQRIINSVKPPFAHRADITILSIPKPRSPFSDN